MTNLIPIIFWSCFGLSVLASIILLIHLRVPRERGPWLVCRVAADGSGGVEFFYSSTYGKIPAIWTSNPKLAMNWSDRAFADSIADQLLGDVVPLSRYVGKGNSRG